MESDAVDIAKVLAHRTPPLYTTPDVINAWNRAYGEKTHHRTVDTAEKLEVYTGDAIRANEIAYALDPPSLCQWLCARRVSTTVPACQVWKTKAWASSLKLTGSERIEAELGDHLRQNEFKPSFKDDAEIEVLAKALTDQTPAIFTNSAALRQWHAKYHQDSVPLTQPSNGSKRVYKRPASKHKRQRKALG